MINTKWTQVIFTYIPICIHAHTCVSMSKNNNYRKGHVFRRAREELVGRGEGVKMMQAKYPNMKFLKKKKRDRLEIWLSG